MTGERDVVESSNNDRGINPNGIRGEGLHLLLSDPKIAPFHTSSSEASERVNALQLEALNAIAFPMVALRGDGQILFVNRAAQAALQAKRWIRQHAGRVEAGRRLREQGLLACALGHLRGGRPSSLLLTDRSDGGQALLSLVPVRERPPTGGLGVTGLLWVIPMTAQLARVREFAHAYNLTRAEQGVLQRLLAGDDLRTAARTIHISIHTARNHLKSILQKTGRRSQSQLLAIATRVAALQFPEF
jgi:DNA-binding CsgD family transcriptional regulator